MGNDAENGIVTINEKLNQIERNIFEYDVGNIPNDIVGVFSSVIENNAVSSSDVNNLNLLNKLMGECLAAMQSSDYLLLADLLKYSLPPLLGRKV